MKFLVCLLVTIFVSFSLSCSKSGASESGEEVVFDDGYTTASKDEIVIDDQSFEGKNSAISQSRAGSREVTRIARDGSQIMTTYDGFGNKTETRVFDDDPLLQLVVIRTSVKGEKQVSVFAQNGTAKELPANMLDAILTAPASELANAAGIYEGRKETPMFVQTNQPPLQPLPSYKFPIRQPQIEAVPAETNEPETTEPAAVEAAKPEGESSPAPKSKSENPAPKTLSVEQK